MIAANFWRRRKPLAKRVVPKKATAVEEKEPPMYNKSRSDQPLKKYTGGKKSEKRYK
jgi:hypothetical protein